MRKVKSTLVAEGRDLGGLARAHRTPSEELAQILFDSGVIDKAVRRLIANLDAKRSMWDINQKCMVESDDGPTQVKAAEALLVHAVGVPPRRVQVLHGEMPKAALSREDLRSRIDERLSFIATSPTATVNELIAARKALTESEAETPNKLTPAERDAEVKRILGVE